MPITAALEAPYAYRLTIPFKELATEAIFIIDNVNYTELERKVIEIHDKLIRLK